jgi:HlyD family secretion protein
MALLAVCVLAGGAAMVGLAVSLLGNRPAARADADRAPNPLPVRLDTYKVKKQKIALTIAERGWLAAQNSADVVCRVKSLKKDAKAVTAIKKVLVEDGQAVKKGQLLLELDASALEDKLREQKIQRDVAKLGEDQAANELVIVRGQNESDLASANTTLKLAKLDLEKYLKGEYEAMLASVKAESVLAAANVELWTDKAAEAERKLKEKLISPARARYAQLRLENARLALAKCRKDSEILKLGNERDTTRLKAAVTEAEAVLKRVELATAGKEKRAMAAFVAKRALLEQEQARCAELEAEIGKCKISAPRDGLLVYYVPEQARFRADISLIAQGEPVSEGQKLITVADLSRMQVVTHIHESIIAHVRVGMPATIRVDAFPNRELPGKVSRVATTASRQNWLLADVKTYRVVVTIDSEVPGLKPGMSATISIPTGKQLDAVLTVPASALLDTGEGGARRSCLVQTAKGIEEREVVVGFTAEKGAEIQQGLKEGEVVLVHPRVLLSSIRDRIQLLRRIDRTGRR